MLANSTRMTWESYDKVVRTFEPVVLNGYKLRRRGDKGWMTLCHGSESVGHVLLQACSKPFGHPFFRGEAKEDDRVERVKEGAFASQRTMHEMHQTLGGIDRTSHRVLAYAERTDTLVGSLNHDVRQIMKHLQAPTPLADISAIQRRLPISGRDVDAKLSSFMRRVNYDLLGRYLAATVDLSGPHCLKPWLLSVVNEAFFKGRYWPCPYPPKDGHAVNPLLTEFFMGFAALHLYGKQLWYAFETCQASLRQVVDELAGVIVIDSEED